MAGCSPTSPWTHPRTTNPSPAGPDGLPCIGSTVRDVLRHHSGALGSGALGRIRTCNLLIRSAILFVSCGRPESHLVAFPLVDTHSFGKPRNEVAHCATRRDPIVGSRVGFFSHVVACRLSNNLCIATLSANALENPKGSGDRRHAHRTPFISGSWPRSRSSVDPVNQQLLS